MYECMYVYIYIYYIYIYIYISWEVKYIYIHFTSQEALVCIGTSKSTVVALPADTVTFVEEFACQQVVKHVSR
jgi:hypothetical protein